MNNSPEVSGKPTGSFINILIFNKKALNLTGMGLVPMKIYEFNVALNGRYMPPIQGYVFCSVLYIGTSPYIILLRLVEAFPFPYSPNIIRSTSAFAVVIAASASTCSCLAWRRRSLIRLAISVCFLSDGNGIFIRSKSLG